MKNKNLFARYKIYFIGGGLLIVIVALIFFVIKPVLDNLARNNNKIQETLLDMRLKGEKIDKLPEIRKSFSVVKNNKQKMNVLFDEKNIVELVNMLESIADDTGNKISVQVVEDKKGSKIPRAKNKTTDDDLFTKITDGNFKLEINLTGDYRGLLKFLYKLNNMSYYNTVVAIKSNVEEIDVVKKKQKVVIPKEKVNLFVGGYSPGAENNEDSAKQKVLQTKLTVVFFKQ